MRVYHFASLSLPITASQAPDLADGRFRILFLAVRVVRLEASAHRATPPKAGSEMKGWAGGSNQTGVGPLLPLEPRPLKAHNRTAMTGWCILGPAGMATDSHR